MYIILSDLGILLQVACHFHNARRPAHLVGCPECLSRISCWSRQRDERPFKEGSSQSGQPSSCLVLARLYDPENRCLEYFKHCDSQERTRNWNQGRTRELDKQAMGPVFEYLLVCLNFILGSPKALSDYWLRIKLSLYVLRAGWNLDVEEILTVRLNE
jgi:hypothetical protein